MERFMEPVVIAVVGPYLVKITANKSLVQLVWETTSRSSLSIFAQQPVKPYTDLPHDCILHNFSMSFKVFKA